jgi:predicted DCC family thiol-disulfide oxidoreductase YuxK
MSATATPTFERSATEPSARTRRLTVLYDERCAFCLRCRDWLLGQPCLVEVELLPAGSAVAKQRYGSFPILGDELVVFDDQGRGWVGAAAFLTCLWATARYRPWAYRFARPHLAPHAERFFRFVSKRRDRWNRWLDQDDGDCTYCDEVNLWWEDA